jgi:50S ribosomal protein L16 3-hydroxylase
MIAQSTMPRPSRTVPTEGPVGPVDTTRPTALLGGLTPAAFMRRHWQKKPLVVRNALADAGDAGSVTSPAELFALVASDAVESRLVATDGRAWSMRNGPFGRRALPARGTPRWTLLVQGVDLHLPAARALLDRFRFVPDARLDDVMVSYASDGGGVGPHVDSYDVFLLQLQGSRRWKVGRVGDPTLRADAPLKLLARFVPEHDWLLDPGDMLYLPPGWGHDGVAVGECLTASIGFRAPGRATLGAEVLQCVLDALDPDDGENDDGTDAPVAADPLYRDPRQPATDAPARIPAALQAFAADAVRRVLEAGGGLDCALGEVLSEPKPGVVFDAADHARPGAAGVRLDRRSRMLYDERHVYLNGESYRAGGRDATAMRRLADRRRLAAAEVERLSVSARALMEGWLEAGWLRPAEPPNGPEADG